ncbi:MAG TPA: hypothetical protein VK494_08100 [Gemmatimonadaceae bacterium]|nr:hypothetical protein [Gemmatimonadaceae bacterium]
MMRGLGIDRIRAIWTTAPSRIAPNMYRQAITASRGAPLLVVRTVRIDMEPKLSADATISSVARPIDASRDFIGRM